MNRRLEKELKLSRLEYCKNQLGYLERSWRPEETCSNEKLSFFARNNNNNNSDGNINCNRWARYSYKRIGKRTGRIGGKDTNGDNSNGSTVRIGQNTEESPGDLRGLAVAQTTKKDHQLMLV